MTKKEILAMKPGRELDIIVAEEVFHVKIEGDIVTDDDFGLNGDFLYDKETQNPLKYYSTDISYAWEVVEKMRELHYESAELYRFNHGEWLVKFVCNYGPCPYHNNPKHNWHGSSAQCQTVPEAICKAALLSTLESS
jgi:hypothetical protein